MIHNGWEFFIMNPFSEEISQSTQDLYMENYNKSYNIFINSLMIPEPNVLFTEDNSQTFMYYITCEEDIINKESDYGFKFLKSKFFEKKSKKIRADLGIYYSQWNIKVNRIYRDCDKYYIELLNLN
jgi:Zn/Cd-binding protein ZinT|tara:strand:+ start:1484 stop:1861 length:378 start_codon:yes stop_codon:yes gene_type:complete